jgi:hypothetical protein
MPTDLKKLCDYALKKYGECQQLVLETHEASIRASKAYVQAVTQWAEAADIVKVMTDYTEKLKDLK